MKKRLKNYLVPHKENQFQPNIFKKASISALFVIIFLVFIGTVLSRVYVDTSGIRAAVISSVVFDLTNEKRLENEKQTLAYNETLEIAAQMKANDMVTNKYFAHTSPTGVTPWNWFDEAGYTFFYAGENLAVHFNDSEKVTDAWMKSPTHRENILNGNFTEIGIAVAKGQFEGRNTTFVVQMFGTPAKAISENTLNIENKPEKQVVATSTIIESEDLVASVKGESTDTVLALNENPDSGVSQDFISVQNTDPNLVLIDTQAGGESVEKPGGIFDRVVIHPENAMKVIYFLIGVLVFIALGFRVCVEYNKHHHLSHVFYGVVCIVLMVILFFVYKAMFPISPVIIL